MRQELQTVLPCKIAVLSFTCIIPCTDRSSWPTGCDAATSATFRSGRKTFSAHAAGPGSGVTGSRTGAAAANGAILEIVQCMDKPLRVMVIPTPTLALLHRGGGKRFFLPHRGGGNLIF